MKTVSPPPSPKFHTFGGNGEKKFCGANAPTLSPEPWIKSPPMDGHARCCIYQTSRYDHITPLLCQMHWLRVPQRISFKLAVMVHMQCVLGPVYVADALQQVARIPD